MVGNRNIFVFGIVLLMVFSAIVLAIPLINFESLTPPNNTFTTNTFFEINVSITEANLGEVIYNWNGTNYTLYNNSLVLMFNFNNVSALGENNTYVVDISNSSNNGTLKGNYSYLAGEKYTGSYDFNSTGYVDIAHSASLSFNQSDDSTVMAWVKPRTINFQTWFDKSANNDGPSAGMYHMWYLLTSNQKVDCRTGKEADQWDALPSLTNYSLDGWTHVACVKSGNTIYVYINGQFDTSSALAFSGATANSVNVNIGRMRRENQFFLNGSIDEVKVFRTALSAEEIERHYYSNLRKYDTDKWEFYTNQSNLSDGTYTYQVYAINGSGDVNSTPLRTINVDTTYPSVTYTLPTPANATTQSATNVEINISITEANLNEVKYNWNNINYTIYDSSLVLMYNFDNVSALGENTTKILDLSKYHYDGTSSGAVPTGNGKYDGAWEFDDGSIQYINTNLDINISSMPTITIAAWIKRTATPSIFSAVISNDDGSGYDRGLNIGSDGQFHIFAGRDIDTGIDSNLNAWEHAVIIINSTNITFFKNSQNVYKTSGETLTSSALKVRIGKAPGNDLRYDGSIDEVRIWNRSLTDNEITQIYRSNLRKYDTDKWEFYTNQSNLTDGTYTYQAYATDSAGNENSTEFRTIIIYTPDPPSSSDGGGCNSNWVCTDWSKCIDDAQNRTCTDTRCHRTYGKPTETQNCTCTENWICGSWSECSTNRKQTRNCNDYNNCRTTKLKPKIQQLCDSKIENIADNIEITTTQRQSNEDENLDTGLQKENNQETVKDTKNNNRYRVIVVLLLIVGAGIFFFYKNKKHKKK